MNRFLVLLGSIACLTQVASGAIVISEWMYNGAGTGNAGEFVEFTNTGPEAVDLTGWSFDDDSRTSGTISLSGFGVVAPGESVILTDETAETFATIWGLTGVKIIGGNTANLGRNDEINLFDSAGNLVDRLAYGDQNYAGTVRTQNRSCSIPATDYGYTIAQTSWVLGVVGDAYGSWVSSRGEIGSPGYVATRTLADFNCNGEVDGDDLSVFEGCATGPAMAYDSLPSGCTLALAADGYLAVDYDKDGDVDQEDFAFFQRCYSGTGNPADPLCTCDANGSNVTEILLNGTSITVEGKGVTVSGTQATITSAGTYDVRGTLSDGQIVVNSISSGTVSLVLNRASITSSTSAPIYVISADETAIVLADGTTNSVSDPTAYVFLDPTQDEPNAAVFSKDRLTISGNGSLTVNAHYNDGITSKDELVISAGTITVNAVDDGIRGKDYLLITGGNITVTSGGDGLKSDNTGDPLLGYITIQDGTFHVTSGGDAIAAQTSTTIGAGTFTLTSGGGSTATLPDTLSAKGIKGSASVAISGGAFTINSADDGLHSDGSISVSTATTNLGITSGRDGIDAGTTLTISAGTISTTTGGGSSVTASDLISAKGIKGDTGITISGGTITINSADDGIHSNGNILIQNTPSFTISSAKDGVAADGTVTMTGGTFNSITTHGGSTATFDDATLSCKAIKGELGVSISGGSITTNSADDSIHSDHAIAISNSATNINITSGRDGISSGSDTVTNDTVNITDGTFTIRTGGGSGVTASDTISAKGVKAGYSLTIGGGTFTSINTADDAIHSNGAIVIQNSPNLTITSAKDGIAADATVNISGGTFSITTGGGYTHIVSGTLSAKGVKADTKVTISGGNFTTINCADDGVHSDTEVAISGGTLNIATSDDGIHALSTTTHAGTLTISNATINITNCYEGLESALITINSGNITVVASEDGINATKATVPGGTEQNDGSWLYINGGTISVTSGRDGIDSNGNITMTGGTVIVQGPPSAPEVAVDVNGTWTMSGGLFVGSGPNAGGMIQAPSTSSAQYTVKATGTLAASTFFHIQNASGTDLVTFKPIRSTYYILFSSSSLTTGVTYSLYTGGNYSGGSNVNGLYTGGTYSGGTLKKTFTMTSKVTSVSF